MVNSAFIGIDGAELSVLDGMYKKGLLSSSIIKTFSPIRLNHLDRGWATIFTGKDASVHGGYYWRIADGRYVLTEKFNATMYKSPPLWEGVHNREGTVGLIGVPTTFPAKPVRGFYVASGGGGACLTDGGCFYPQDIIEVLEEVGYIFDLRFPDFVGKSPVDFVRKLGRVELLRWAVSKRLIEKYSPLTFFATVFKGVDIIQHFFWDRVERLSTDGHVNDALDEAVLQYYHTIFTILEEAVKLFSSGTVVIASDHGFCGHHKSVYLTKILKQKGYVRAKRLPAKDLAKKTLKKIIPDRAKPYFSLMQRKVAMEGVWQINAPELIWEQSVAVPFKGINGLYLNKKGIFPEGNVELSSVPALCKEVCEYLKSVTDLKTDKPLFLDIFPGREQYKGPMKHHAPDIVFELPRGYKVETDLAHSSKYVLPRKTIPTSPNHMPGQGHIGIHASPALYAVFKDGRKTELKGVEDLAHLHNVLLRACGIE